MVTRAACPATGNEQNSRYTGAQQAEDFEALYNLTVELWPDPRRRPVLFGPA